MIIDASSPVEKLCPVVRSHAKDVAPIVKNCRPDQGFEMPIPTTPAGEYFIASIRVSNSVWRNIIAAAVVTIATHRVGKAAAITAAL